MTRPQKMQVAIIGCGAVTELYHLPAAAQVHNVQVTLLVDKNRPRAEQLARQYGVQEVAEDYTRVWHKAKAAIVALPNHLHAPVSIDLLNHGIHVLVEKPMALSVSECDAMIEAAARAPAVLAVGFIRRFQRSAQLVKALLASGFLGEVGSFDIEEDIVYDWPITSDFAFRRESAGGGVLIDSGIHAVDTLLWWLGDFASFEYLDDSYGGVEADCELRLAMKGGAKGVIRLSRTHQSRWRSIIRGTKAALEVAPYSNQITLRPNGMVFDVAGQVVHQAQGGPCEQKAVDLFSASIADWVNSILTGRTPAIPGTEGRRSAALVELCYANRKPLLHPWVTVPCSSQRASKVGEVGR